MDNSETRVCEFRSANQVTEKENKIISCVAIIPEVQCSSPCPQSINANAHKATQEARNFILWLPAWALLWWNTIQKLIYLPYIFTAVTTLSGRMEREVVMHSLEDNIICPMWNSVIKASLAVGSMEQNKFCSPGHWGSYSGASAPSKNLAPSRWAPGTLLWQFKMLLHVLLLSGKGTLDRRSCPCCHYASHRISVCTRNKKRFSTEATHFGS